MKTHRRTAHNRLPVGTVSIRTRHKRGCEQRAWVKTAEPNVWKLRAQIVWDSINGPIPDGMGIHHRDRDKLNDSIGNLELVSKAEHLAEHRPEFKDRALKAFIAQRKKRRWSTKSSTKKTGRPCAWTDETMLAAVKAYKNGEGGLSEIARRFGVTKGALYKRSLRPL